MGSVQLVINEVEEIFADIVYRQQRGDRGLGDAVTFSYL